MISGWGSMRVGQERSGMSGRGTTGSTLEYLILNYNRELMDFVIQ
jgi:hypothetical protein